MPVFFQQQINEFTRLGIWKIEETEDFFKGNVPVHREVTHPHKRVQHLAGRFLLQFLFPDFPYALIQVADTRKPFLEDERFHFSISHCGDFAAAIVSTKNHVGIDIEIPVPTIGRIRNKFLTGEEQQIFSLEQEGHEFDKLTILWSAKEAVYKWYGLGSVDFKKHIRLKSWNSTDEIECYFELNATHLAIHYKDLKQVMLAWIVKD